MSDRYVTRSRAREVLEELAISEARLTERLERLERELEEARQLPLLLARAILTVLANTKAGAAAGQAERPPIREVR